MRNLSNLSIHVAVLCVVACGGQSPEQQETLTNARIHPTTDAKAGTGLAGNELKAAAVSNLTYHGGVGGIGIESAPKLYLVFYGSQWSSDPTGEAAILQSFYASVSGSSWLSSVNQYCQGVASGTVNCGSSGTHASNIVNFAGTFHDTSVSAPTKPTQAQLAAEAVRAASFFGNTTAASNVTAQYVIATPHGHNSSGFGTQYCAYHSSTSSSFGNVAYTNLPYITDAGASCGSGFVNSPGTSDGVTIVGGHEMAETITDQFPNGGWLDSGGEENGDKCAWISPPTAGFSRNVTMGGHTFPVQSLWSNSISGCSPQ